MSKSFKLSEAVKRARLTEDEADQQNAKQALYKAFKAGPEATRAFLDTELGQSDLVRNQILGNPQNDGELSDDVVKVSSAGGPAMNYKPTQSEIDLMKSVSWPLGSAKNLLDAIKTGPTAVGIVTSGDLIIDGHHRWSGAISIGGNRAKISGKDVNWPGTNTQEKLAAAQIAIAATLGPNKAIPSQAEPFKTNIMGKNATAIAQMIMTNVNKQTDKNAPGALLNDKMMQDLTAGDNKYIGTILSWLGKLADRVKDKVGPGKASTPEAISQLRLAIATKVGQNLEQLPKNADAPARKDMPQFDPKVGGPSIDSVIPHLGGKAAGDVNLAPPFTKKEALTRALKKIIKEEVRRALRKK